MADNIGPYGLLLTTFFDGTTGMRLQAIGTPGKDALLLGAFLTANEFANMIGLYELSLGKLARKLPVVKGRALTRAFELLDQERFAHYDAETEFVWVREMARVRLRLERGQVIRNPRILTAAQNCYQRVPLNPFLSPFFDRYHVELALKHRRGTPPFGERIGEPFAEHIGERSPNGATPEVRTQVLQRSSDQVPVHQESVQAVRRSNQDQEQGSSTHEEQPALARRRPALEPASFQTLCAIATEVLTQHGQHLDTLSDLVHRVKALCVERQRDYGHDLDRLRGAIDGALMAYRKRCPDFQFASERVVSPAAEDGTPERSDPTLRLGRMPVTPVAADELIPVDGTSAPRGTTASLGDLASSLRADNVEDFNARMQRLSGGGRRG